MSMLMYRFEQPLRSSGKLRPFGKRLSDYRRARLKGFCMGAFATLAMGVVLAGLIALKTAIFLPGLHY